MKRSNEPVRGSKHKCVGIGPCPGCKKTNTSLYPLKDRSDGFEITQLCFNCLQKIIARARALRSMSHVIAYGLHKNPEGGVIRIGGIDYKLSVVPNKSQWGEEYGEVEEGEDSREGKEDGGAEGSGEDQESGSSERTVESCKRDNGSYGAELVRKISVAKLGSESPERDQRQPERAAVADCKDSADLDAFLPPEDPGVRGRKRSIRKIKP